MRTLHAVGNYVKRKAIMDAQLRGLEGRLENRSRRNESLSIARNSLAEGAGATSQEETASSDKALAVCCEQEPSVAASGIRFGQNYDGVFLTDSGGDAECEPADDHPIATSINIINKIKMALRLQRRRSSTVAPSQRLSRRQARFSGPNDLRVDLFPKGQATPAEVIACASFFFNGGTVFEPWMKKALEFIDDSRFEKADVICVSDGISDVSPEAQAEWARRREERGMRAYGALISANQGESLLGVISDAVFRLDDLRGDLPALEEIFSTV